ncbi:sensor domain-containing diguanylate cyclase [Bacillus solitudinis]|uniref:sensor domain-containing diguanylate cyclase n=1 Tax=Bacillus solitudinis TaxID=2014074 RepID=UPI000C23A83C|nr:sensor domain-containing diguanylate cyclase [Bacillus solitudinis]
MRQKGKLMVGLIIIILVSNIVYTYISVGLELFVGLLSLLIGLLALWLGKQYDDISLQHQKLKITNEKVAEKLLLMNQKNKDYELLLNSLEGAIFSLDVRNNKIYFTKGAELIYGYSDKAFSQNINLWKELIHSDDYEKVEKYEKQLLQGNSSQVKFRINHPETGEKWLVKRANPLKSSDGTVIKVHGQIIDITKQIKLENELKQLAYHDELTDLPNRKSLDRHIEKALARSKRHNHNFTLMFIDLDDFKNVNDSMGHEAGDFLLKEVVIRIKQSIREEDLISRIGGDEFIVVLEETNLEEIEGIAERILENISLPYLINEQEVTISLSIGISMFPDDGETKETLIDHADKAMYFAKNNGKNNFKIYTSDLNDMEFKKVGHLEKWVEAIQNSKIFSW